MVLLFGLHLLDHRAAVVDFPCFGELAVGDLEGAYGGQADGIALWFDAGSVAGVVGVDGEVAVDFVGLGEEEVDFDSRVAEYAGDELGEELSHACGACGHVGREMVIDECRRDDVFDAGEVGHCLFVVKTHEGFVLL